MRPTTKERTMDKVRTHLHPVPEVCVLCSSIIDWDDNRMTCKGDLMTPHCHPVDLSWYEKNQPNWVNPNPPPTHQLKANLTDGFAFTVTGSRDECVEWVAKNQKLIVEDTVLITRV
jgi:hypothetical protein